MKFLGVLVFALFVALKKAEATACTSDADCTATGAVCTNLAGGHVCSDKKCACPDGYAYGTDSACHVSPAPLGEYCDAQVYCDSSVGLSCESNACVQLKLIGEACTANADCVSSGSGSGSCDSVCECSTGFLATTGNYGCYYDMSSSCSTGTVWSAAALTCLSIGIGDACTSAADCANIQVTLSAGTVSAATCTSDACACPVGTTEGSMEIGGITMSGCADAATYGIACVDDADCMAPFNLECGSDSTCDCKTGFVPDAYGVGCSSSPDIDINSVTCGCAGNNNPVAPALIGCFPSCSLDDWYEPASSRCACPVGYEASVYGTSDAYCAVKMSGSACVVDDECPSGTTCIDEACGTASATIAQKAISTLVFLAVGMTMKMMI